MFSWCTSTVRLHAPYHVSTRRFFEVYYMPACLDPEVEAITDRPREAANSRPRITNCDLKAPGRRVVLKRAN